MEHLISVGGHYYLSGLLKVLREMEVYRSEGIKRFMVYRHKILGYLSMVESTAAAVGAAVATPVGAAVSTPLLASLQVQSVRYEDVPSAPEVSIECVVCGEFVRLMSLGCRHIVCEYCLNRIKICPMCRILIDVKLLKRV
jgi:hypothetical protein